MSSLMDQTLLTDTFIMQGLVCMLHRREGWADTGSRKKDEKMNGECFNNLRQTERWSREQINRTDFICELI